MGTNSKYINNFQAVSKQLRQFVHLVTFPDNTLRLPPTFKMQLCLPYVIKCIPDKPEKVPIWQNSNHKELITNLNDSNSG